mgnify:CR=1 FL=1
MLLGSGLITNNHLPEEYKTVKPYKVSSKLKGLINLTQIDNIGGTADVGLLFHDKPIKFFSVTEYKSKTPSKCICNPSGTKYYGVVKSEVIEAKNIFNQAREKALKEINSKKEVLDKQIDEEIVKAEQEIKTLQSGAADKINKIAIDTSSELIQKLIGAEVNNSSISAIVDDLSKRSGNKYYGN